MKIGIIGSGNVGKALAAAGTRAGHTVTLSARSPEKAQEAAKATNSHAAGSNQEAVKDADLVVLAVPADKVDDVVGSLASELDGKVIVDVTNRVDLKDPGQVLDGSSMAEHKMSDPKVGGTRLDGFVAGDDEAAKQKALEFIESIGFRPLDAGPLTMARALEAMGLLNIVLQIRNNWPWQSGWKLAGPTGDEE